MVFFYTLISFLRDKEYRQLLYTTFLTLTTGTIVYHFLEGWSWIDSLYFSTITLSTIGYGDFYPHTDAGKIFTILYIIVGVGIILSFINTLQHHYSETRKGNRKV
ncbi:MAG: two pore domain potassium channel family protein [Cytophagales bacterium]|nr:two pore domain potassium channel family protein [Cytophagales bacterium]